MNLTTNLIILLIAIPFWSVNSQNGYVKINKSEKLEKIILLKKDLNSKIENLKIQIYNGNREQAEKIKEEYIEKFNDVNIDFSYKPSNHHFLPQTLEQKYYKSVFDNLYPNCDNIIPRYWMPNFIEASDPSARTLELYSNK